MIGSSDVERRFYRYSLANDSVIDIVQWIYSKYLKLSISLHYILYDLGSNQDIQEQLYQEIKLFLNGNEKIDKDKIIQMKLLKNVVKESMR